MVIEMLLSKYLKIIGNLTHNQMTVKKNHFIIIQEGIIIKQFFFCYRLKRKISFDFYSFGLREEEGRLSEQQESDGIFSSSGSRLSRA